MADESPKTARNWITAVGVGAVAGLTFWWLSGAVGLRQPAPSPTGGAFADPAQATGGTGMPDGAMSVRGAVTPDPTALRYVAAYQTGRWDDVIEVTCWMQERLLRVQMASADPSAREAARAKLRARLDQRSIEENQLRPEGVEDQYVFTADATIETLAVDEGRSDLERAVKNRTWFRVAYPERGRALRDDKGIPIRSLAVGVNVSVDGFVLKGNVIGNLDIDWDSMSSDWAGFG